MKKINLINRYKKHQRYVERKRLKRKRKRMNPKAHEKFYYQKSSPPYTRLITPSSCSNVLNILEKNNFSIKEEYKCVGIVDMKVPECFCFSYNPDETIGFLRKLYTHLTNINVSQINLSHLDCSYIGVCASTIMDIIIMECLNWRKKIHSKISVFGKAINGCVSKNAEVDLLVKMSGLIRHLNVADFSSQNIEQLPIIKNGKSTTVAEDVIAYFNRSLARHGLELTKLGKNYFGMFLGEIVDNCSIHGGENVVWYTLGHYSYDDASKHGKCKLTIFDFGDTIYESLKYHSDKSILKRINHYVKKSWISAKSVRDEETLYTLFSLQQRVSRIVNKGVIRGNGTVTFIENILNLFDTQKSENKSRFSITSGKCSILFDGTYKLSEVEYREGFKNKVIAFNASNNLYESPDSNYVRTIENSFPGTILSMDLYIDSQYIRRSNV